MSCLGSVGRTRRSRVTFRTRWLWRTWLCGRELMRIYEVLWKHFCLRGRSSRTETFASSTACCIACSTGLVCGGAGLFRNALPNRQGLPRRANGRSWRPREKEGGGCCREYTAFSRHHRIFKQKTGLEFVSLTGPKLIQCVLYLNNCII